MQICYFKTAIRLESSMCLEGMELQEDLNRAGAESSSLSFEENSQSLQGRHSGVTLAPRSWCLAAEEIGYGQE